MNRTLAFASLLAAAVAAAPVVTRAADDAKAAVSGIGWSTGQ